MPPARTPGPSRDALDRAEAALAALQRQFAEGDATLRAREARLAEERRQFGRKRAATIAAAEEARRQAEAEYTQQLRDWRE